MVLLRLMLVDRGGSAAGRKARVEGIGEKMAVMKRRARERSIVFVWGGGEEKFGFTRGAAAAEMAWIGMNKCGTKRIH